jgi:hypothetical protein
MITTYQWGLAPVIGFRNFQIIFGISLDLDNFLTLKNANIFVFSSLNRNFALSLQPEDAKLRK